MKRMPVLIAALVANRRRGVFYVLMWIIVVILTETVSYVGGSLIDRHSFTIDLKSKAQIYREQQARILAKFDTEGNDVFDPDLGWTYRPGFRGELYSNNSLGLRGTSEYESVPESHILRITAFGDSFVYGSEVGDEEVWTHHLERLLPGSEVLNFGVGGYGTDQALLRYRKHGKAYTRDVVLIGFVRTDLRRNVNVYTRFISTDAEAHFKPRFRLDEAGKLVLVPNHVSTLEGYRRFYEHPELIREVGQLDYAYKPLVYENPLYDYSPTVRLLSQAIEFGTRHWVDGRRLLDNGRMDTGTEAFTVTLEILREFHDEVLADGATPIILMFPEFDEINGDPSERVKSYQPLMDALREQKFRVVDLAEAFDTEVVTRERHIMIGGHYSPHSNELIARQLADVLRES